MDIVRPDAHSPILRATDILEIKLVQARPGPPHVAPDGWNSVPFDLDAVVADVLKGALPFKGRRFAARVHRNENPSPMYLPVPGVWSAETITLQAGADLLVFAVRGREPEGPAELLAEPVCIAVEPGSAAAETRLAIRYLRGEMSASQFLAGAPASTPDLLFAELLSDLLEDRAFAQPEAFWALLHMLEAPGLAPSVRAALIDATKEGLHPEAGFTQRHFDLLVIAMLRIAAFGVAPTLKHNLVAIDIPAMVGLKGGERRSSAQIFQEHPEMRGRIIGGFKAAPPDPDTVAIVRWLSE